MPTDLTEIKTDNRFFPLKIKRPRNFKTDFLSGLTVALALIPEAIAFAFVAGVHPKVGLYAAFMMGLITAIFGGRPGMISGATGAVAVIFAPLVYKVIAMSKQSGMTEELAIGNALNYLFIAVIMMGVIQVICGALKLGKFIRLVPHPVMLGFVNGLAIIIFKAQFGQFYVNGELLNILPLTVMLSLIALTMAICLILPRYAKSVPATLVSIIVVSIVGSVTNIYYPGMVRTVLDFVKDSDPSISTIAAGFPVFEIPSITWSFETFKFILPFAFIAAMVGLIESLMTLTLVDELTETKGDGNRECLGQGLANILNGFFGGMGGCAMIGQSMINIRGGGRGRTSGIVASIFLLAFILVGAKLIEIIPLAALVGVMFMVVMGTFEWSSLRLFNKIPHSDVFIIVLVSTVTVMTDLAIAVFIGVIMSALIFSWQHGESVSADKETSEDKTHYKIKGPLFFGSIASFKEIFDYKHDRRIIILDFQNSSITDHSGIEGLESVLERYKQNKKELQIINLDEKSTRLLQKAHSLISFKH
jgi:SulP family sulfate permease